MKEYARQLVLCNRNDPAGVPKVMGRTRARARHLVGDAANAWEVVIVFRAEHGWPAGRDFMPHNRDCTADEQLVRGSSSMVMN